MLYRLDNPPKLYARNAAGRLIQIAGRPGEIGRYDNVVLPDEREIRRLRPVVAFIGKLKPAPFNYGTASKYDQRSSHLAPITTSTPFHRLDPLLLVQKL